MRVFAAVLVLAFGVSAAQADEDKIAKALEKAGAVLDRDEKKPGKAIRGVQFSRHESYSPSAADLKLVGKLQNLEWLSFHGLDLTDDDLKHFKGLKNLRELSLPFAKVTDAG